MRKFNVFRQVPTLFDPFETDDMEATEASSLSNPVDGSWSEWMAPIMKIQVDPQTQFPYLLPKQFYEE